MSSNTNSQQAAAVEVALSLLETCPHDALSPHLDRIERIANNARHVRMRDSAAIYDAVFSDDNLLAKILEFDGSLAFYHKHYSLVVGFENPLPRVDEVVFNRYFRGTRTNILVSKKWKSMVMGGDGWDQWKVQSERRVEREIAIARNASRDESLTWTARICAMAIANDIVGLNTAFQNENDSSQGLGAALAEQKTNDEEHYSVYDEKFHPVPVGHPFHRMCVYNLVEDICDEDEMKNAYVTSIAYAAASVGSIEALVHLESILGNSLWGEYFDQKGDGFLKSLVWEACSNPTLDCTVKSIRAIFPGQFGGMDHFRDEMLHDRHRGGNGNHLHLAAARGHKELVKVLIEGGMNPNKRCERISPRRDFYYDDYYDSDDDSDDDSYGDARDRGVKQYPLPENWATIRGHDEVANFISSYSHGGGVTDGVKRGYAKRFNTERGFGFIRQEHGRGKDVFVHISDIEGNMPLEENEYVEFTTQVSDRGLRAINVTRLGSRW